MNEDANEEIENSRERVNSGMVEDRAVAQGLAASIDPRNPNVDSPTRIPLGRSSKVDFSDVEMDRENFAYYAFLDDPQRPGVIGQAKAAFWEECVNMYGQPARRPGGYNTEHVLMRLPMKYWKEDLDKDKKAREAMMADAGTLKKEGKNTPEEYAPTSGGKPEGGDSLFVSKKVSDNPYTA